MADSDSSIAWHRARIKTLRDTLQDLESAAAGGATLESAAAGGATIVAPRSGKAQPSIAELKRTIKASEELVDAYDRRHARRPRGTDTRSIASVRSA